MDELKRSKFYSKTSSAKRRRNGSINALVDKLGDRNIRVRKKAERELVKIGEPATESMIQAY